MLRSLLFVVGVSIATLFTSSAIAMPLSPFHSINDAVNESATSHLIPVFGCHSNRRFHMVYKWGYRAWHRHRPNCQPVRARHCHRNLKKHWHSARGKKWHRHVGPRCRYRRGKVYGPGFYPGGTGCIKVGNVWICV